MTESLRRVAREAYALAREARPPYTRPTSRKDYTQAQLFAILAVKTFLKTDPANASACSACSRTTSCSWPPRKTKS
jgi:hypothetical protein